MILASVEITKSSLRAQRKLSPTWTSIERYSNLKRKNYSRKTGMKTQTLRSTTLSSTERVKSSRSS